MIKRVFEVINENDEMWEQRVNKENIQIYRKKGLDGAQMMLKINAQFEGISALAAFSTFSDIAIRQQWDAGLKGLTIIE